MGFRIRSAGCAPLRILYAHCRLEVMPRGFLLRADERNARENGKRSRADG